MLFGGKATLRNVGNNLRKVLEMSGILKLMPIEESFEEECVNV